MHDICHYVRNIQSIRERLIILHIQKPYSIKKSTIKMANSLSVLKAGCRHEGHFTETAQAPREGRKYNVIISRFATINF